VSIDWLDEQPKPVADAIERITERAGTWEASGSVLVAAGELLSAVEAELKQAQTARTLAAGSEAPRAVAELVTWAECDRHEHGGHEAYANRAKVATLAHQRVLALQQRAEQAEAERDEIQDRYTELAELMFGEDGSDTEHNQVFKRLGDILTQWGDATTERDALKAALQTANAGFEEFERKFYLEQDAKERLVEHVEEAFRVGWMLGRTTCYSTADSAMSDYRAKAALSPRGEGTIPLRIPRWCEWCAHYGTVSAPRVGSNSVIVMKDCKLGLHPAQGEYACDRWAPHPRVCGEATGGDGTMDTKETETPRRADMGRWTPAERAINDAMQAVEAMAADVRLTDAVVLLGAARDSVADYIDGVQTRRSVSSQAPSADHEEETDPPCEGCGKPTADGHRTDDDVLLCEACWLGLTTDIKAAPRTIPLCPRCRAPKPCGCEGDTNPEGGQS
jgi:hypothetical protein